MYTSTQNKIFNFPKNGDVWHAKNVKGMPKEVKIISLKNSVVEYFENQKKYEPLSVFTRKFALKN